MKYLSFDIEATGLEKDALIIEFGMIPIDSKKRTMESHLKRHFYIQCPSFKELEPNLNDWVKENNKELIEKAHKEGIILESFKESLETYLESSEIKNYFDNKRIVLFGKSLSAIDLPFLNRDLGWDWMNKYFHHQNLDLSSVVRSLIDLEAIPKGLDSGSELMKFLGMGEVCHTALEDAINTADMYFKLLNIVQKKLSS